MTHIAVITFLLVLAVSFDKDLAQGRENPCNFLKCLNGGTCNFPADFPICACASGYGGDQCEYKVPVKNGTCPKIPNDQAMSCHRECDGDFNCPDTQKCCNTFCERMCANALYV